MDERLFAAKAKACADKMFRVSYLLLRNVADCEDAMQEALLKAWRYRFSLRDPAFFETWLIRILINESRSLLKRRARRAEGELLNVHAGPEPEEPELRDAIRSLPVKLRVPLILHHLEGYTQAEIASMLSLPLPTIKARLHRARKQLKLDLWEGERNET